MPTALSLIEDALDDIQVKSAETALTTSEVAKGVRTYNRIIASLDASGLHVGAAKVSDASQETFIPDWMERLVIMRLSIELAPSFGKTVAAETIGMVDVALKDALRADFRLMPQAKNPNMPTGSGVPRQYTHYRSGEFEGDFQHNRDDWINDGGHPLTDGEGNVITGDDDHE